jgi:hypothetical protein
MHGAPGDLGHVPFPHLRQNLAQSLEEAVRPLA